MATKRAVYDLAEFKALPAEDEKRGRFEALVSVFGNVDVQGDRVMEGAFQKSIEGWRATGAPIPVIWSHAWGDPNAHIGSADPADVVEVPGQGLKVAGSIDLDNPFAAQVYRLLKERRVRQFSFGYEVKREKVAKDGANELLELGLIEVGPTLKGANPSTELLAVKSDLEDAAKAAADEATEEPAEAVKTYVETRLKAVLASLLEPDTKAGRSISSKNESKIRTAVDSLQEVLASLGGADDETAASEAEEAKAKADEPKVSTNPGLLEIQALIMNAKE